MRTATTATCPDCDGPGESGLHYHATSCPLLAASRRRAAWDAAWLAAHPDESGRYRPVVPSERAELRALGVALRPEQAAHALVVVAADGAMVSTVTVDGRVVAGLVVYAE